MNVCTKCHGYPSNCFWDISLKTTNLKLMVAREAWGVGTSKPCWLPTSRRSTNVYQLCPIRLILLNRDTNSQSQTIHAVLDLGCTSDLKHDSFILSGDDSAKKWGLQNLETQSPTLVVNYQKRRNRTGILIPFIKIDWIQKYLIKFAFTVAYIVHSNKMTHGWPPTKREVQPTKLKSSRCVRWLEEHQLLLKKTIIISQPFFGL